MTEENKPLSRTPNGGSRPVPDPTELTDRAINRLEKSITQYIDGLVAVRDERLAGIDEATKLRLGSVEAVPHQIDEKVLHAREIAIISLEGVRRYAAVEVAHLREVDDIRFQAAERLAARESELNALALAAAFAAQKEASAKEAEYTRIASTKSESATAEAIGKLGELFQTQTSGLGDKVDDLKDRVGRIESIKVGSTESRTGLYAAIGAIAAVFFLIIGILAFIAGQVR